jgi:hypothetical protein
MTEEFFPEAEVSAIGISLKELLEYYKHLCEQ